MAAWSDTLKPKEFKYPLRKMCLLACLKKEKTLDVKISSIREIAEGSFPCSSAEYDFKYLSAILL